MTKFGFNNNCKVTFVTENDGTTIDDFDYTLLKHFMDTQVIIVVCVDEEKWNLPAIKVKLIFMYSIYI